SRRDQCSPTFCDSKDRQQNEQAITESDRALYENVRSKNRVRCRQDEQIARAVNPFKISVRQPPFQKQFWMNESDAFILGLARRLKSRPQRNNERRCQNNENKRSKQRVPIDRRKHGGRHRARW